MKDISIKIKNYTESKKAINIVNNSDLYNRLFRLIVVSSLFLAFCYLVILLVMVWNIVDRKSIEASNKEMINQISSLELAYLDSSERIDITYSNSLGFYEIKPTFAQRKSTQEVVAFNK